MQIKPVQDLNVLTCLLHCQFQLFYSIHKKNCLVKCCIALSLEQMQQDGELVHGRHDFCRRSLNVKTQWQLTYCCSVSQGTVCAEVQCYSAVVIQEQVTQEMLHTFRALLHRICASHCLQCAFLCMHVCAFWCEVTCGVFSHLDPLNAASGRSSQNSISVGQYHHGCMGRGRTVIPEVEQCHTLHQAANPEDSALWFSA